MTDPSRPRIWTRVCGHLSGRGAWWWVPVFYLLVVLWTYRDVWHQHGAATGFGWDTIDTHGPDLEYMAHELRHGRFSLWNPYDKGGYPVYADPIVNRYYPFAWPFIIWCAVVGPSWWLVQIEVLAHHVAIACCMHLFLRSRGLPVRAALLGGVGLVVSAPLLIHKASNILWPIAWVPLVWLAIDAAIRRPSWRRGVAVAAAFSLCATAGSPPGMFYAGLLVAPYAVWRVVTERPAWKPALVTALAGAVVIGLVLAVVAIPGQSLADLSARERWAKGDAFALSLSFAWTGVFRDAFAAGTGPHEMYVGAAIALLAVCALIGPVSGRRTAWLFVGVAIFGFVLVGGATTPVLPWLVHHVPGFGQLRIPGRYKMLAIWSLAAAAGFGAASLTRGSQDATGRPRLVAVLIVVGVAIAGSSATVLAMGSKIRPAWWSVAAMVIPGVLVVVAVRWRQLAGLAGAALIAVVLIDAPLFIHRPNALPAAERRQLHLGDAEVLARLDGIRDRFRLYDEFVLGERVGARHAVRDFRGYPAVDPLCYRRYVDVLDFAKRDPAIVTDYNVRWVLQAPHFRYGTTSSYLAPVTGHPAFAPRGDRIFEARHPAPLVAWYGAVAIAEPAKALAAVRAAQDASGQRVRAVIEPDAAARFPQLAELAAAPPGSADGQLVSYQPDAIAVTVDAPRAGLVVLNEIALPGWTVELDGSPAPLVMANYFLRGVYVGPGHHVIRWRFEPPWARLLIAGYLVALAIMFAAAASAIAASRSRRRTPPASAGSSGLPPAS